MTPVGPLPGTDQVCPYLGLADDPATHYALPSGAHRCHAPGWHDAIGPAKQARDCLTSEHITCPRYVPVVVPVRAVAGSGSGREVPARRPSRVRRVAAFAMLLVLLVGVAASGILLLGLRSAAESNNSAPGTAAPAVGPTQSPSAVAVATATPTPATPTPTPTPTATPSPTPSPTPSRTPAPTIRPVPTPSPLIYVVKRGDTLILIARQFGVSVPALKAANRDANPGLIENPNLIFVGQRIIIPVL